MTEQQQQQQQLRRTSRPLRPVTHAADQDRDSATASLESRHVACCPPDDGHKARWIPCAVSVLAVRLPAMLLCCCSCSTYSCLASQTLLSQTAAYAAFVCQTGVTDNQHHLEHQAPGHAKEPGERPEGRSTCTPACSLHACSDQPPDPVPHSHSDVLTGSPPPLLCPPSSPLPPACSRGFPPSPRGTLRYSRPSRGGPTGLQPRTTPKRARLRPSHAPSPPQRFAQTPCCRCAGPALHLG